MIYDNIFHVREEAKNMEKKSKNYVIAIDGEAGTGKSTIAKLLAKKLNIVYLDTGAMYRCVTLACISNGVTPENIEGIKEILKNISISFKKQDDKTLVMLNGCDVTEKIRTPEVDSYVAKFAAIREVRDKMTPLEREMGKNVSVIMEGRDIGTVVFPDADVKVYLDCSTEERANRRYKQNIEKGINTTYEEVLKNIKERHILETKRDIAPLTIADGAKYIDTTNLSLEQVQEIIEKTIREKVEI